MMYNKHFIFFFNFILFSLSAQTKANHDILFYKNRIKAAPDSVFKKFVDAGMSPVNHVLTEAEYQKVANAFSLLPPLHLRILKEHLHSISFMDNMPNTALTSPIEPQGLTKEFNITFRAGILNETISQWATWKEKTLYDASGDPALQVQIDAGNLDAFVYVLLHEATHVVDAVLKLTPHAEEDDTLVAHTLFTKNTWLLFNSPKTEFTNPILEKTRFRSGKVQPIASAGEIYKALEKTPFTSLYGMASWYEDIAELVTIYHLTVKLKQPFVICIKENGKITTVFEPMKNKLVQERLQLLQFIYD